jgi:hypothetical protein
MVLFLVFWGFVFLPVQVNAGEQALPDRTEDCYKCHRTMSNSWEQSAHGRSANNEEFIAAWDGLDTSCLKCHTTGFDPITGDSQYDSVFCSTCHYPTPIDHPDKMIPTDVSSRNCGQCHLDTFEDWEKSAHNDLVLNCNNCHSPHTTALKTVAVFDLCVACHTARDHDFPLDSHFEAGITCADCHVNIDPDAVLGDGHSQRSHTFIVGVEACTDCHSEDLGPTSLTSSIEVQDPSLALFPQDENLLSSQPGRTNPWLFALASSVLGLTFGTVLGPRIRKWLQRESSKAPRKDKKDD